MLFADGEYMDEYCVNYNEFAGSGDILHPENVAKLSNRQNRKAAPFFALAKTITVPAGKERIVDSYAGISTDSENGFAVLSDTLYNFCKKYKDPAALTDAFDRVVKFVSDYSSYIDLHTEDESLNSYISKNLPFQVLYQSFVTRAFAWTQKGGRMVGFREIQDMYASMYYMNAMGNSELAKDMIKQWACNVYKDGYANHNFYWSASGAGGASDDQLWLIQAVYRYIMLTGDKEFLDCEYPISGSDETRSLFDTMTAAVTYSGKISIGRHGLPLLDGCDWNDCLCLDDDCVNAVDKMRLYREQLEKNGQEYGVAWENHLTESVMNAFLLKLALDELSELSAISGRNKWADEFAAAQRELHPIFRSTRGKAISSLRCLINNPAKGYEYLGGAGDGLSDNPDFPGSYWLNCFSWSILSGVATENQISDMLGKVNKYLRTGAGLKLYTPAALERLKAGNSAVNYFPGDRENGGVFKHANMMATAAMLKAAKQVKDETLAAALASLAFETIGFILPYKTLENPFVLKGNPRYCTQYNNSQSGENIGPMLSGTASWLSLSSFEFLGISHVDGGIELRPILPFGLTHAQYNVKLGDTVFSITVEKKPGFARADDNTKYFLDGKACGAVIPNAGDGKVHTVKVEMM